VLQRVRASFDPERSGDFYVVTKPNVSLASGVGSYIASHGTPWDYDRRVPIIFWAPGLAPTQPTRAVSTTAIMPTLAGSIGLPVEPATLDGECLAEVAWARC